MKRIWFAVVFLSIAFFLCLYEQTYISNVYQDLTTLIVSAEKSDKDEYTNSINKIKKYWNKNRDKLCAIADHGTIDELGKVIDSIDTNKDEETKNALAEAKALTEILYSNQRVTFSNVF